MKVELGHHWVEPILAKLGEMATLPANGILAGQSVASALMDLCGMGGGVYNDIDIFLVADEQTTAHLQSEEHLTAEALRLGIPAAVLDEYSGILIPCDNRHFEILGATQDGVLNYVWCASKSEKSSKSKHTPFLNIPVPVAWSEESL